MRTLTILTLSAVLAGPVLAGPPSRPKVRLEVTAEVVPERPAPGARGEIRLSLGLPEGIVLNRYPGITFTPAASEGLAFDEEKTHVGISKPVTDQAEAYFENLAPLAVGFSVAAGASGSVTLSGELKYFYCVKKSGYCAPGKQTVTVRVPVASG